jgi:hypothetical protein
MKFACPDNKVAKELLKHPLAYLKFLFMEFKVNVDKPKHKRCKTQRFIFIAITVKKKSFVFWRIFILCLFLKGISK